MQSLVGILPYIQIVLSIFLIGGILLQQSEASLGAVFGDSGESGGQARTRRGFEKTVFTATIVLAILFIVSIVVSLFI